MNRIEHEKKLLMELATSGNLLGYPETKKEDSYFEEEMSVCGMTEYFSEENDALERQLEELYKNEPSKRKCIPIILAAVEKSRGQDNNAVVHTELYNYTM